MDQREKSRAVQPDQRYGSHRFGIAAVELVSGHQILIKEQLTGAVADAIPWPTAEFHQPAQQYEWPELDRHDGTQKLRWAALGDQLLNAHRLAPEHY